MGNLDYGVIGNCQTAALISKKGNIEWLCFPEFDSPSIFAAILDKEIGGEFGFVVDDSYKIEQSYFRETNILCTKFSSQEGAFEVFDFMPRYKTGSGDDYYLPAEIYRYIRLVSGNPKFAVNYNPVFNYAREVASHEIMDGYVKSVPESDGNNSVYLYSSIDYEMILAKREVTIEKDEFLLLSYNQKLVPTDIDRVYLEYSRTKVYWLNWVNRSKKYEVYNRELTRSLLILKLMSFQPTGAVLAALTTSIPETAGDVRNWDYRFCWLRDASMMIDTLISMGHQGAAKRFLMFIKRVLKYKSDTFQIMYGINGERKLTEEELPHLSGFMGSKPVRIGNAAYHQKQNDSLGYLMDVIYQYYQYFTGTLDEIEDMWEVVKNIVNTVRSEWHKTDQGIWEYRNREQHFVFSKVMCWVTMDRASKIADYLNKPNTASMWREVADEIHNDIMERGWKEGIGAFSQAYENDEYDSSVLLMEAYGFLPASHPKFIRTVDSIKENLMKDGLMYRYKDKDDFGEPESAFTISTFWLIRALYVTGREQEAKDMFDRILSYSNHLGLFSEDLDFKTKAQLGNFPQAYSHLAIINTIKLFAKETERSRFIRP